MYIFVDFRAISQKNGENRAEIFVGSWGNMVVSRPIKKQGFEPFCRAFVPVKDGNTVKTLDFFAVKDVMGASENNCVERVGGGGQHPLAGIVFPFCPKFRG